MSGDWAGEHLRELVLARSGGVCECCGSVRYESLHHRAPRRMGGTRSEMHSSPANITGLCGHGTAGCHGAIESNRALAGEYGWLLGAPSGAAGVPVLYRGGWALLADGGWVEYLYPTESVSLPSPAGWMALVRR